MKGLKFLTGHMAYNLAYTFKSYRRQPPNTPFQRNLKCWCNDLNMNRSLGLKQMT